MWRLDRIAYHVGSSRFDSLRDTKTKRIYLEQVGEQDSVYIFSTHFVDSGIYLQPAFRVSGGGKWGRAPPSVHLAQDGGC